MADLTGQTLGKYQILERLGRGGMADVYQGYQPGLDRYVAVKVMHAHLSEDPDFITRFRREAKSVAELRHPNIVQVFDFDVQGDVYYMVMEFIEGGETLKQRLLTLAEQGQRLPIEQTLDILIKLADALAYAHGKGMVHRDIKPANVLLPSLDRPVLSDFGIARLLGETGLTASGAMIGTPAYMSPEQGRGEHGDARSDIYSLGIVLYEMLTGRPPYDADTPYAIILKHINDPLIPPHALIDPMPEAVERIVLKCLAKEPADRFAGMVELREALRGAQSAIGLQKTTSTIEAPAATLAPIKSQPGATTPAPTEPSPASPVTRSRGLKPAWLIGGVAALIVVGIIIVLALRPGGGTPQSVVEATAGPATAVPIAQPVALTTTPPTSEKPTAQAASPTATTTAQPAASVNAPQGTVVVMTPAPAPAQVQTLLTQGFEQLTAGEWDAAHDLFTQALKVQPNNAQALVGRALVELYRSGDMDQAAADLTAAAPALPNDPLLHFALGLQHRRSEKQQNPQLADVEFTQAIDRCGDNALLCARSYEERGQVRAWDLNKPQDALADFARVVQLSTDPQMQADAYSYQSNVYYQSLGDLPKAIDAAQHAYQVNHWSGYLEYAAQYAVHSKEYDKALDIYNQLLTAENGDPRLLAGRAYVEWASGDAEKAQQSAERALQLDTTLREAHYVRGLALLDSKQPKEALVEFQAVTANATPDQLDSMSFPFLNQDFGREINYDMARASVAAGDTATAQKYLTQALQKSEWAAPYILRAEILKGQGDLAGAREAYLKALDNAGDNADLQAAIEKALTDLTK